MNSCYLVLLLLYSVTNLRRKQCIQIKTDLIMKGKDNGDGEKIISDVELVREDSTLSSVLRSEGLHMRANTGRTHTSG